jgi:hypothetical protein
VRTKITDLTLDTNYTLFSISEDSYSDIQAINIQLCKTSNLVPSLGTTIKNTDFDFKGNTLNILCKATGTALL